MSPFAISYHYILIDCPPALDLLTVNAMVAADSILIPMQCEFFALEGISQLLDTVDRVRDSFGSKIKIEGVLLTMYDDRTNLTRQVEARPPQVLRTGTSSKPSFLAVFAWRKRPASGSQFCPTMSALAGPNAISNLQRRFWRMNKAPDKQRKAG